MSYTREQVENVKRALDSLDLNMSNQGAEIMSNMVVDTILGDPSVVTNEKAIQDLINTAVSYEDFNITPQDRSKIDRFVRFVKENLDIILFIKANPQI